LLKTAMKDREVARAIPGWAHNDGHDPAARKEHDRLYEASIEGIKRAKPLLRRIRKMRAVTGPGIFAKALSRAVLITGAADLAMSLAEDLITCEGLRATLWPAGPETQP
jgi:hypothetical protein